jgi:hypothetical protein
MLKYSRHFRTLLMIGAVAALAACSSDAKKGPDSTALGADSALNRDLAMAGTDTTAQPQLKDVPATSSSAAAPTASAPARTPARTSSRSTPRTEPRRTEPTTRTTRSGNTEQTNPGARNNPSSTGGGAVGSIPAGSTLSANASSKICTNTNKVGDHITATIANSVSGSNGAMIPAGATLNMTVTQLKRSENANDPVVMEFAVNSVTFGGHTYPIEGSVTSAAVNRVRDEPKGKDIQKVAIGAGIGAIAGRILGKSTKGAVIGGAVGAAGGAATAAATANYSGCIDQGGSIVVKLNSAATVRV